MSNIKKLYTIMAGGAVVGMGAAFWQTLEKLALLKNKDAALTCNLSSVFNCNNVLNAPQSSLFGFPNSIMCLMLFTTFLAVALVGLTGGTIGRKMRFVIQGMTLGTLMFAFWFLYQSTYVIGAICIFCLFCFAGLLAINGAWLRINAPDYTLSKSRAKWLKAQIAQGADLFIWLLLALVLAAAITFEFYV